MANKKAAQKAVERSAKRALSNHAVWSCLRTLEKKLRQAISAGAADVGSAARAYISSLDKAVKRSVIHENAANRRKSLFAKYAAS